MKYITEIHISLKVHKHQVFYLQYSIPLTIVLQMLGEYFCRTGKAGIFFNGYEALLANGQSYNTNIILWSSHLCTYIMLMFTYLIFTI